MSLIFKGHTSGSILSNRFQYNGTLVSYTVTDTSGDGGTVNVAVVNAGDVVHIDYITLTGNESVQKEINIQVVAGNEFLIISSGNSIDYYVSFDGVQ